MWMDVFQFRLITHCFANIVPSTIILTYVSIVTEETLNFLWFNINYIGNNGHKLQYFTIILYFLLALWLVN